MLSLSMIILIALTLAILHKVELERILDQYSHTEKEG
jgi:hypothetical protein